jgi:hypothetical protein
MNAPLSRRSFLTAVSAVAGLVGFDLSTAWTRPLQFRRQPNRALAGAVDLSIRSVARDGLSNLFPAPFEISMLRERADLRQAAFARAYEILGAESFQPGDFSKLDIVEVPKRDYGARRLCAVMEPMDSITYLALALLAAPAIERNRISASKRIVHSNRYRPALMAGKLFDRRFTYASFLKEARRRRAPSDVLVKCDIANFFGSVSPSVLETALSDASVEPATADRIVALLHYWSSQGWSGLPVGSHGSKILAEAVLCQIDVALRTSGIEFVRFIDDFRLIAPDRATAEEQLDVLQRALAKSGLALNSDKTDIIEPSSAPLDPIELAANYQQTIPPRSFRTPTPKELKEFRNKAETKPDPKVFLSGELVPTIQARRAMREAICTGQLDFIKAIPAILERYPEFSRYVTLALAYVADQIPERIRRDIGKYAASAILDNQTPTFVRLDFLRLLGEPGFVKRKTLLTYALATDPRGPEFRAALDALRNSGGIPTRLSRRYDAADQRARRAIALGTSNPKRLSVNSDPFLTILV